VDHRADNEDRIALFLDYENLAIGARDSLGGMAFDFRPIADALAERGRVVVRRAYADWSYFDEDRRMLTRSHVELIEIPQRMGAPRRNAADIKMTVDALELAFERDYISTFVLCTGDSDFTPLVHKLRELNKRVIGIGVEASTSALLPAACDEFLFYERLEGVEPRKKPAKRATKRTSSRTPKATVPEEPEVDVVAPADLFRWLDGRKLDAVVHMGAISDTTATDADLVMENNFRCSMRLLDWCTAGGVPFIYASSAATYGDGAQGSNDRGRVHRERLGAHNHSQQCANGRPTGNAEHIRVRQGVTEERLEKHPGKCQQASYTERGEHAR